MDSFHPDKIFASLEDAAEDMANTQAQADQLEELKKSVLAQRTLVHMGNKTSRIEAETKAIADPEYTEYVTGMVEARKLANRARAKYKNLLVLAELRRTEESSRRSLTR